ncbi:unnamed protein product [Acanthosepion pharaonis]|uniref:Transmembrane protein n=1 Tax=Acanthosepion pharaonis TaxID=158019 RepID=A0A812DBM5_ACAPH|nr:unnamed protein product [Sepia pharaonis]
MFFRSTKRRAFQNETRPRRYGVLTFASAHLYRFQGARTGVEVQTGNCRTTNYEGVEEVADNHQLSSFSLSLFLSLSFSLSLSLSLSFSLSLSLNRFLNCFPLSFFFTCIYSFVLYLSFYSLLFLLHLSPPSCLRFFPLYHMSVFACNDYVTN